MAQQRFVWVKGAASFLIEGDPEREDARFWRKTDGNARFGQALPVHEFGQALPVLLREGWEIVSVTGIGEGQSHVVLQK